MERRVTLNHTKWDCKYHVVFIPKYRRKVLYAELRKELGQVFQIVDFIKGKSAIHIARTFLGRRQNFTG